MKKSCLFILFNFLCLYIVLAQNINNCGTVTDVEGNTYKTVQLGSQCWMAENLRTKHYADGRSIKKGVRYVDGEMGNRPSSYSLPYWYYPEFDVSKMQSYGLLYNWAAVMGGASSSDRNPSGVQGICPNGWHVPSDAEWIQLTNYVENQNQYSCSNNTKNIAKALAATSGWLNSSNICAIGNKQQNNNTTGFSAVSASYCNGLSYEDAQFEPLGYSAYFWSSTTFRLDEYAEARYMYYNSSMIEQRAINKNNGFSVRCIRN